MEYRDMTFCPFYSDCVEGRGCLRALTPEVMKAAELWANKARLKVVPICQFREKPDCWEKR